MAVRLDTVAAKLAAEVLARRPKPDEPATPFDDLDETVDDLLARRRSRNGGD